MCVWIYIYIYTYIHTYTHTVEHNINIESCLMRVCDMFRPRNTIIR